MPGGSYAGSMLVLADYFFHIIHLAVIGFNLFGWVLPATRRAHRWLVALTAICWLGVGLAVGAIGYCPLTDWHWQVKRALGEEILPRSYIDYLLQLVAIQAAPQSVDIAVGVTFAAIVVITSALWRRDARAAKHLQG